MAKVKTKKGDLDYDRIGSNIRNLHAREGIPYGAVAAKMHMNARTYLEKRKAPWDFDLGELALVAKILHTDPATLMFGEIVPASPFEEVRP